MEKFYCGFCGFPNLALNKFCNKCGSPLVKIEDLAVDPLTDNVSNLDLAENRSQRLQKEIFKIIKNGGVLLISIAKYSIVVYRNFKTFQCYLDLNDDSFYNKIKLEQIYKIGFNVSDGRLLKDFVVTDNEQVSQLITDDCIFIFDNVFCLPSTEPIIYEILEEEKLENENIKTREKSVEKTDVKSDNKKIGVFIIVVIILIAYYLHHVNDSSNNNQSTANSVTDSVQSRYNKFKALETTGKLVGVWINEKESLRLNIRTGYKFIISKQNKLYVEVCDPDEETLSKNATTILSPLASKLRDDKTQYTDVESPEQYYVINGGSNDLLLYDNFGLIYKCKNLFIDYGNK